MNETLEDKIIHLLVLRLDGFSVDLVRMEDGVPDFGGRRKGFSVGGGRSVAAAEIIDLVRAATTQPTEV